MTQYILCPHCSKQASFIFKTYDYNRRTSDDEFSYYKCPDDGLIFLHPIPDDLAQYYPVTYYTLDVDPASLQHAYEATEGYKVELLNQFTSGKRLLEIGPGNGGFVFLAQRSGYDATVIEMDKAVCEYLQSKMNIPTINTADVVEGLEELGKFDAIVLWHVIEHMPDVWQALQVMSEHLKPNGIIILAAPNPKALQLKIFKQLWTHLDAPRHVYLIPADMLVNIGKKLGLEVLEKTDLDRGSLMWNRWGWSWSLRNLMHHRLQNYKLGYIINKLISPIERREFRGATYTIVMRKISE